MITLPNIQKGKIYYAVIDGKPRQIRFSKLEVKFEVEPSRYKGGDTYNVMPMAAEIEAAGIGKIKLTNEPLSSVKEKSGCVKRFSPNEFVAETLDDLAKGNYIELYPYECVSTWQHIYLWDAIANANHLQYDKTFRELLGWEWTNCSKAVCRHVKHGFIMYSLIDGKESDFDSLLVERYYGGKLYKSKEECEKANVVECVTFDDEAEAEDVDDNVTITITLPKDKLAELKKFGIKVS